MTTSKRIFCFIMCLMLLSCSAFVAGAEEETTNPTYTYGQFMYKDVDGGVCITGFTGEGGDVFIPSEIDGKTVVALGDEAFWYKTELTAVSMPSSLEYLGNRVFQGCKSLTAVSLPDSVSEIGDACFSDCENLVSLNIPASLVYVGAFAFDMTPWITQFDGNSSIIFGGRIFYKYLGDADMVVIPDGVVCISGNAFQGKSLSHVTIPDSVAFIGDYCFLDCVNLKEMKLPKDVYYLGISSVGVKTGEKEYVAVEDFTIYSDNVTGKNYAEEYGIEIKASKEYKAPANLPEPEECSVTGEIKTSSGGSAISINPGAVAAIVISAAGCVLVIGGIALVTAKKSGKKSKK